MPIDLPVPEKEQLIVSLAALVCSDSGVEMTAENLEAVISGSGNKIASYWAPLYASYIEKAEGLDKFTAGPGSGGGGAPAAASTGDASAAAVVVAPVAPKEEEVDALDGGMDMFGGSGGGGDY
mmetsp:Transcript_7543/g.7772  ORF Transcript_7543/g.7772 Transcript_7543/m.7772 type:complete len:123 (+) Transcript_7543:91-459(+)|eukprot:CAMPEP_0182427186 /NCGR_PEP_ID=MMETSP1167-20130531/15463_1 /TAXON_ID=2988 /ORGANISM="Mallomonas Sp, Strain CCMP3275" /LENGTH=122 /DNA_ID=CAMNT_0024609219 /DNA_START=68 /DNA_END=436 /DNA_ORIENTATION=+